MTEPELGSGALREAAERLLPFIWESNFDEEVETAYERAVVALRDALSLSSPIEPPTCKCYEYIPDRKTCGG